MSNSGYEFEGFVQYVFQILLNTEGEGISVSRGAIVKGRANHSHQIDVFYQFQKAGVPHRVAIECKDWKRPVDITMVRQFESTLRDVPDLRGVMISRRSFTDEARSYGESSGILMLTEESLPTFPQALGIWIQSMFLPDETTPAEPFFALLEKNEDGTVSSLWFAFDDKKTQRAMIPLFLARRHAQRFIEERQLVEAEWAICGLRRKQLHAQVLLSQGRAEYFSYIFPPENFAQAHLIPLRFEELIHDYCGAKK